jgi:large exoprotein involved in heme utilization and adhesion
VAILFLSNAAEISTSAQLSGNAGNVGVNLNTLNLQNSTITSRNEGTGNAGEINLQIGDRLTADNGVFSTNTINGIGGQIVIQTGDVELSNNSLIDSNTSGSGNAGAIDIFASSTSLNLSTISTQSAGTGNAGTINLDTQILDLTDQSSLSSAATSKGRAGNLNLQVQRTTLFNNSQITTRSSGNSDIIANAVQGNGGNIEITTQGILGLEFRDQLTPQNDITASSQFGLSGTVSISSPDVEPSSGLVELPVNLVDASQQVAEGCSNTDNSRFVVTGRGGLPSDPIQEINSDRPWADMRDLSAFRTINHQETSTTATTNQPLIQATGWRRNTEGKVELLATTENVSSPQFTPPATCAMVSNQ